MCRMIFLLLGKSSREAQKFVIIVGSGSGLAGDPCKVEAAETDHASYSSLLVGTSLGMPCLGVHERSFPLS